MKTKIVLSAAIVMFFFAGVAKTGAALNVSIDGNSANTASTGDMTISSDFQVHSDSDFDTYVQTLSKDPTVDAVSVSDTGISMTFKRPAKLFGFIPVNVHEKVKVSDDASSGKETVSTSASWWSIFAKSDLHSTELSSDLQSRLDAMGAVTSTSGLSAPMRAQILGNIKASSDNVYANGNAEAGY